MTESEIRIHFFIIAGMKDKIKDGGWVFAGRYDMMTGTKWFPGIKGPDRPERRMRMNRFQFGICEWCLPPVGLDVCRLAAGYGLDGVALDMGSLGDGLRLADPRIREWYKEESRKTGVSFCTLALNVLFSFDTVHRGSAGEEAEISRVLDEAVKAAADLEIPVIQVPNFPGNAITGAEHLAVMAERFRDLCNRARPFGIVIGTENTLDAEENRELLRRAGRENLRVYYDTENPYYFGFGESPDILAGLEGFICQVHVKDGVNGSMSRTPLGKGNGRFMECAQILRSSGYSGWIILENEFKAWGRDNHRLLAEDVRTMKQAFEGQTGEAGTDLAKDSGRET